MVTPSRHEHASPHKPTFDKGYISKREDEKKLKTIKAHFDRLMQFGLLFRRLTSLLPSFVPIEPNLGTKANISSFTVQKKKKKALSYSGLAEKHYDFWLFQS